MHHSKKSNDFGPGLYLGESFKQAAIYVYTFAFCLKKLRVASFDINRDWMISIAYYRRWIDRYKNSPYIKTIVDRVEEADVVTNPLNSFVRGESTDLQCQHALSATNFGRQYVIKTEKGVQIMKRLYGFTA